MPYGDGTGPAGRGPLTGRGMGPCAGYGQGRAAGRRGGFGFDRGFGRGYRRGYGHGMGAGRQTGYWGPVRTGRRFFAMDPVSEKEALMAKADWLEENLSAIKERLEALENDPEHKEE